MEPEEQLDQLLSRQSGHDRAGRVGAARNGATPARESPQWDELLDAAGQFAVWGVEEPASGFASRLEAELLERFARPAPEAAELAEMAEAPEAPRRPRRVAWRTPVWRAERPLLWAAVAAVLLVVGAGALSVAATQAQPGQLLYGLRVLEGGAPTETPDAAASARASLQRARDALASFDTLARQGQNTAATSALAAFIQQDRVVAAEIDALPGGGARDTLEAQLTALRGLARRDLRAALPGLDWVARASVTTALRQLGEQAPLVARAKIAGVTMNGDYIWIVTISGTDFSPAAQPLIDGQPVGTVVSRSSTEIIVHVQGGQLSPGAHSVGVGDPDGAASIVTGVSSLGAPDDHGGARGGGPGDGGGSSDGGGSGH